MQQLRVFIYIYCSSVVHVAVTRGLVMLQQYWLLVMLKKHLPVAGFVWFGTVAAALVCSSYV
jgi:hypothetical protein